MTVTDERGTGRPRRTGPPLPVPALAWAALTVGTAAFYPGTLPSQDASTVLHTLQTASFGAVSAMLLVASAVPLLVWAAAVQRRLHELGARVAGPTIGLVGGILAAVALALSGLAGWTAASVAPDGDAGVVLAVSRLSFAAGGPLFAAGLGLAIAGVAVPALVLRLVPRWLAVAGLVLGVLGAVALVVLAVPVIAPVLPVVRFGGLLWILAVSVLLPLSRRSV